MYLKKLELQGFKSFANKTELEFMPGITAVVGPNGSGKSNISDAIRWVLGEQSMKSLRGTKLEDVIFAGTENRKSVGFAEVSMIIDNTDGALPIEFNEVVVTRRTYRSGESGYFINKAPCRLKDIQELFMDTGIGKDGYSIIGQGKIDEILSNKSEERRHIFEEAAGIVKYRTRKQEAEKKLEQTEGNLARISDILVEIESKIEPLRVQSEKAKKYLGLKEELKVIEVGLFLDNIEKNKEKLEKAQEDENILKEQQEAEEKNLLAFQEKKAVLKTEFEDFSARIEELQNKLFNGKTSIEKLNSEINIADTKILSNLEEVKRLKQEIEEYKTRIQELNEEKDSKENKRMSLSENKEKFSKELSEKEEELKNVSLNFSEDEKNIEELKTKIETNKDLSLEKKNLISTSKASIEMSIKRQKQINEEKQGTISELDSLRMEKQEIENEFMTTNSKRNNVLSELNEINKIRQENSLKIKEYVDNINILESDLRIKESKLKFLSDMQKENEGYFKSVKSILNEAKPGGKYSSIVCGTVADLVSVPKEYEIAIEQALGGSLQNIVTNTEKESKELINYLRENNLGRASFLPISAVKGKKIDKIKSKELAIGVASDLVSFDSKYEQIFLSLLGKTVITKDMDDAIKLSKENGYSFRIVTLLGDIINPSGQMTGRK